MLQANSFILVALSHKISRNRDILMDYENQLKRTKEKHSQNKNRFDLMGSVRNDISQFHSQNQSKMNMMSNENDKLKRLVWSIVLVTIVDLPFLRDPGYMISTTKISNSYFGLFVRQLWVKVFMGEIDQFKIVHINSLILPSI